MNRGLVLSVLLLRYAVTGLAEEVAPGGEKGIISNATGLSSQARE